ncbi:2-C-methyl-D-erythritol 2,4-cyclodiphosphate synthase [Clostridium algidicarnis]|uniref:2-C-methyl-D-erythritol 2,4-cyclodiphosphate synthase n=2 Tax=Clostridium algidicarnis TaxID=37659 RepID=A0A2S6FVP1_9CLOT|nr:2-C-methyl-D-erythritol 2,4-cyclodiphosphate synthase [Clostridium algidicarnis]MBU3220019.1 2-C-methyl-D-erythritol 2,4-cyclodiphosphate synthase [Clostridium algidicarnis]MCB2287072.1 2-C-methyl-D-erythritol 2,4-cyclodiphosphate synthase [Clostridium algidicarnis]PPK46349.1 2-C-methyl-D-erythritol 2,4-cyclodiphosphate synthase [Clostridium algidicarnis DSM 15099]
MRIGLGYDVHKLVEDRSLILGGVTIPNKYGLLGHSDADVLVHAIMDSILGAASLGDIGTHFPDNNLIYKDISSLSLLKKVYDLILKKGFSIGNIDATIIAEAPKLSPYIDEMRNNISSILGIDINQINIKATTEEGLGFTGSGEGMASQSICLLISNT